MSDISDDTTTTRPDPGETESVFELPGAGDIDVPERITRGRKRTVGSAELGNKASRVLIHILYLIKLIY